MSKQNNLTDFLTGVADAIRTKKGTTALINPQNFESEIASISGGGGSELNIAYGNTAPEDTSKLWIKSEEPSNISFPVLWKPEQIVDGITDTGTTLPTAANYIATATVGTKIYLLGGYSRNGSVKTIQVFDTSNNTIQTLSTTLPQAMYAMGIAAVDTKIYLFGGYGYNDGRLNIIQVFDTTNNTIQTLSTTLQQHIDSLATAAVGNKIYLFGGYTNNSKPTTTIQVFDTTNNTIQILSTTLPQTMHSMGIAAVGNKIYLFGGQTNNNSRLDTIRVFNITNNTIQTLSRTLSQSTDSINAAAVGNKIYLFGGKPNNTSYLNKIQVFDTSNNTIQTLSTTLPQAASSIGTAAVGTKIYLFGGYNDTGYKNTISLFTVNIPLSSNNIIIPQEYYSRTFKVLKAPTEVEVAVKYVYKGDQNLAKLIDAYLYDGANWVNVNTGDFTFTKLYAPKISISGKTLTITNDGRNGSKVTNYKVYNGSTLLTTITATTLDLTTVITANGTYNISVIATGTGYADSDNSNVVEYNYAVYNITTNLTNVTANASNPTTVSTLASSTLTFTANTGYTLPDSVTVTGATGVWNKDAGTLTLSNPTDNVTFTIAGVQAATKYTITVTAEGGFDMTFTQNGVTLLTGAGTFQAEAGTVNGSTNAFGCDITVSGGVAVDSTSTTSPVFTITGDGAISYNAYCLIEGTQITLADGTTKAIEDITYDDELLVWNFYAGRFDKAKPAWIKVEETTPKYNLVKFSNGSEVGFAGPGGEKGYHRIFNKEAKGFTHTGVADTPNGTTTFAQDETFPTVVSQEIVEKEVKFYNVITDKHYNLFANGILTSCKLSNKYRIEDMRYIGEKLISDEQEKAYFERIENKRK